MKKIIVFCLLISVVSFFSTVRADTNVESRPASILCQPILDALSVSQYNFPNETFSIFTVGYDSTSPGDAVFPTDIPNQVINICKNASGHSTDWVISKINFQKGCKDYGDNDTKTCNALGKASASAVSNYVVAYVRGKTDDKKICQSNLSVLKGLANDPSVTLSKIKDQIQAVNAAEAKGLAAPSSGAAK